MATTNRGLHYSTIEGYIDYVGKRFASMKSSQKPNDKDPERESIKDGLLFAESEIDMYLKKGGYSVPINVGTKPRSHSLLKIYAYNICTYNLHSKTNMSKPEFIAYNEVKRKLVDLKNGDLTLPDDDGWDNLRKLVVGSTFENRLVMNAEI